jgi:hypothetical protein
VLRHRAVACAAGEQPDWSAVRADFEAALSVLGELGAKPAYARTLREFALALAAAGSPDAEAQLTRATAMAEELGLLAL